jgi:hypothetical protein
LEDVFGDMMTVAGVDMMSAVKGTTGAEKEVEDTKNTIKNEGQGRADKTE